MGKYYGNFKQRCRQIGIVVAVILGFLTLSVSASAADNLPGLPEGVHTVTGDSGMKYAGWVVNTRTGKARDALFFTPQSDPYTAVPGSATAVIPESEKDDTFELRAYTYNPTNHTIPFMTVELSPYESLTGQYTMITMSSDSYIDSNNPAITNTLEYGTGNGSIFNPYSGPLVGQSNLKIATGVRDKTNLEPGQYLTLALPFKLQNSAIHPVPGQLSTPSSIYDSAAFWNAAARYTSEMTIFANGDYDGHALMYLGITYDHGYPVVVKHVDTDGNPLGTDTEYPAEDNQTSNEKKIDLTQETISGYVQAPSNPTEYAYSISDGHQAISNNVPHVITLVYSKIPDNRGNGGGGGTTSTTPTTPTTPTQPHTIPTTTGQTGLGVTTTVGGQEVAAKGQAVYALKGIYLYKNKTFTASARRAHYPKARRINRPMFVVTGYTYSKNGALRYIVRDVNHTKKTDGWKGYITASSKYVVPVYYAALPKSRTITVIAKNGINAYNKVNLTSKAKHYKKGAHLKVKKIVRHNLTTRYVLSNGDYITANKKLIIAGKY